VSDENSSDDAKFRVGVALSGVAGIYLLFGAWYTAHTGKWFVGFPPQLDAIGFIFGGGAVGAYVEAGVAGILGFGFAGLAIAVVITSARRRK
jgi:hypothetical protein